MSEDSKILISHTEKNTDLLGPYRRFVIWVHGCCFDCEGCLAENTKNGAYTETNIKDLAQEILMSDTEGITISGGEPFLQAKALFELVSLLKSIKDIGVIIYSGFTLEELQENDDSKKAKRKYIFRRIFPDAKYLEIHYPTVYRHRILYPFCVLFRPFKGMIKNRKKVFNEYKALKEYHSKDDSALSQNTFTKE